MACALSRSAALSAAPRRVAKSAVVVRPASVPAAPRLNARRSVVARAEAEDFDAFLNKMADKFEKTDNKPIVIAYLAAAVAAFFTAEWFIHLPALDILLGFPIQLIGRLTLPYLGVRWFVDGQSAGKDIEDAAGTIISKLPGLDKK